VLAVKSCVQGYFYSCFCTLKGEYIIFSSSKTVSSQIIGRLSPVFWGTHGSEVPLTIFSPFFNLYMYHFFSAASPFISLPANPTGNFYDYGQAMFRIISAWKSPIELRLTRKWFS
jgi:hypothetical protein